jgi:hypothetical protein
VRYALALLPWAKIRLVVSQIALVIRVDLLALLVPWLFVAVEAGRFAPVASSISATPLVAVAVSIV